MSVIRAMEKSAPLRLGARLHPSGQGATFRAFCTSAQRVELVRYRGAEEIIERRDLGLAEDGAFEIIERRDLGLAEDGAFEVVVPEAQAGWLYRFALDGREVPDPYARFLPYGVHGPAELVSEQYAFQHRLPERPAHAHVIYELHVGSFTAEGTYASAASRLESLVELGITTIELMPLAAFPGARGWGYDGVGLFAPFAPYGRPEDLCAFIDRAHGLGLSVLLDVVYNHLGPAGNYLGLYSERYFRDDLETPWGQAPNLEDAPMRALVLENARYWVETFRFDGLRFDATHALHDTSSPHVVAEAISRIETEVGARYFIAEDERNDPDEVARLGVDATWADDFHHVLHVLLTGERDGYYAAYEPTVEELARTIRRGWLYEGQDFLGRGGRGKPAPHLPSSGFVYCLENHDQVGNRPLGTRLGESADRDLLRVATALLLFLPMTPLLFMGQEWGSTKPFLYFTDHDAELGRLVTAGRRREFAHFEGFGEGAAEIPDPQDEQTFLASKLDWSERRSTRHAELLELHQRLLGLRHGDPVLASECARADLKVRAEGAVLWVERYSTAGMRTLVCNFGDDGFQTDAVRAAGRVVFRTDGRGISSLASGKVAILLAP